MAVICPNYVIYYLLVIQIVNSIKNTDDKIEQLETEENRIN